MEYCFFVHYQLLVKVQIVLMTGVMETVMREVITVYVTQVPQILYMVTLIIEIIREDLMMVMQTAEQIAGQKEDSP